MELQRAADAQIHAVTALLKARGLSPTQYNVLRILRGAGEEGLPCREVGERMIKRVPDVTRLLDRMEAKGWVKRRRLARDRRVVQVRITPAGLKLVGSLDEPVRGLHRRRLGRMGEKKLRALLRLLEEARRCADLDGSGQEP